MFAKASAEYPLLYYCYYFYRNRSAPVLSWSSLIFPRLFRSEMTKWFVGQVTEGMQWEHKGYDARWGYFKRYQQIQAHIERTTKLELVWGDNWEWWALKEQAQTEKDSWIQCFGDLLLTELLIIGNHFSTMFRAFSRNETADAFSTLRLRLKNVWGNWKHLHAQWSGKGVTSGCYNSMQVLSRQHWKEFRRRVKIRWLTELLKSPICGLFPSTTETEKKSQLWEKSQRFLL